MPGCTSSYLTWFLLEYATDSHQCCFSISNNTSGKLTAPYIKGLHVTFCLTDYIFSCGHVLFLKYSQCKVMQWPCLGLSSPPLQLMSMHLLCCILSNLIKPYNWSFPVHAADFQQQKVVDMSQLSTVQGIPGSHHVFPCKQLSFLLLFW